MLYENSFEPVAGGVLPAYGCVRIALYRAKITKTENNKKEIEYGYSRAGLSPDRTRKMGRYDGSRKRMVCDRGRNRRIPDEAGVITNFWS